MGNVEDCFVNDGLRHQARRGENELLVRIAAAVDSRKNRRTASIEADVGMKSHQQRAGDVRTLVRKNAGAESDGESSPISVVRRSRFRGRGSSVGEGRARLCRCRGRDSTTKTE